MRALILCEVLCLGLRWRGCGVGPLLHVLPGVRLWVLRRQSLSALTCLPVICLPYQCMRHSLRLGRAW